MVIITKSGKKLSVDTTGYDEENDWELTHKPGALVPEDFELKHIWILNIFKCAIDPGLISKEWEFIKEVHYDHEPTKEELAYEYSINNLGYNDYIQLEEGWQRDW